MRQTSTQIEGHNGDSNKSSPKAFLCGGLGRRNKILQKYSHVFSNLLSQTPRSKVFQKEASISCSLALSQVAPCDLFQIFCCL